MFKAEPAKANVGKEKLNKFFNKSATKPSNPEPIPKPKKQQVKLNFSKSKDPKPVVTKPAAKTIGSKRPAPAPTVKRSPIKAAISKPVKKVKIVDEEEKEAEIVKKKVSTLNLYSNAESDEDMEIDTKEPEVTPSPVKAFKKGKAIVDSEDDENSFQA